jgi:Holliday junction resolvasome RuvABC endonuclease subunit
VIAIGLDPSMTGFGWAVLLDHQLDACGVWETHKADRTGDTGLRARDLAQRLDELVEAQCLRAHVVVLCVEALGVFGNGHRTAMMQGRALGLVDMCVVHRGLKVIEVAPALVKRVANQGTRRVVDKAEVRHAIERLYPNAAELIPAGRIGENASDAIAIAHVGLTQLWRPIEPVPNYVGPR